MSYTLKTIVLLLLLVSFTSTLYASTIEEFIPQNSFLYLKLQGIEEITDALNTSKTNGILNVLGTLEFLDLFGNQSGFALWLDKKHRVNAAYVVDTNGDMVLIQRLKKIAPRLIGLFATTLKQDAGKHRSIQYSELNLDENKILFGYMDEFFVIGVGERSFKTIIDTYQNRNPSILKNANYVAAKQNNGTGEIYVFCNIETLDNDKKMNSLGVFKKVVNELTPFTYLYTSINLNKPGNFLKVYAPFTAKALQNIEEKLPIQTKMPRTLDTKKTIQTMSGKDDLFIAISPIVTQTLWSLLIGYIEQEAEGDFYDALNFFENEFNVDFTDDVIPALTGEIALSISEFQPFVTPIRNGTELSFQVSMDSDGNSETETSPIEQFGVIFSSINRTKWDELNNTLANTGNTSTKQFFEYGGTTVSQVADSIYLSNINELSIASFGEDDIISLIDTLSSDKHFPIDIEQVAQSSIVCLQLNLITFLEAILGTEHISNPEDVLSLLTSLSVENNALTLQAAFLDKKSPLESLAVLSDTAINGILSSMKKPSSQ